MKIGFIGIGAMGAGIVRNLIKAGHDVTVWDRFREPVDELATLGASIASSLAEAAQHGVVLSMLAHDEAIQGLLLDTGWLDQVKKPLLHVNLSTISVRFARKLAELHAEAGVDYVGAPVFGRPDAAHAGTLNLVVGGAAVFVVRLQPVFEAISKKVWHVGERPYQANLVKIAGNMMIASAIEAMAEATALGTAHDIDRNTMLDVYLEALFPCGVYRGYGEFIRRRQYEPVGFKLPLGLKDVRLALEAGESARVPLPLAGVVRDSLLQAMANGYEDKDWSSLAEMSYSRAGIASDR
ncbi:NAD(P)-dependent oxidoreductase [Trinickia mobilis]|uniref:NAD(P)-dependent oxidoreductase n=1 Tax=Trinickia mobilis TaxID=2816356 RepID=UPI001A908D5B|nr:NAD(P)-dependent oxidoreductase [Trinickia mobilis]